MLNSLDMSWQYVQAVVSSDWMYGRGFWYYLHVVKVHQTNQVNSKKPIEVVLMSHAGIKKSHNFITIQTCCLKAIPQWITVRACRCPRAHKVIQDELQPVDELQMCAHLF